MYNYGSSVAAAVYGLTKLATHLKFTPGERDSRGARYYDVAIYESAKPHAQSIGELTYKLHPEGHAEITSFFIDPDYTGKGHGQATLRQLMDKHQQLMSDTRTGTTADAQRAFKKVLAKIPNIEVRDLHARELDGTPYTDMNGEPTSIWYAKMTGVDGLSDQNLDDIAHNAMYHRRRQGRTLTSALLGMGAGGIGGAMLTRSPVGGLIGGVLGATGTAMLTDKLQHEWDKRHNLHGNW